MTHRDFLTLFFRILAGEDQGGWHHEHFRRDDPSQLKFLRRTGIKGLSLQAVRIIEKCDNAAEKTKEPFAVANVTASSSKSVEPSPPLLDSQVIPKGTRQADTELQSFPNMHRLPTTYACWDAELSLGNEAKIPETETTADMVGNIFGSNPYQSDVEWRSDARRNTWHCSDTNPLNLRPTFPSRDLLLNSLTSPEERLSKEVMNAQPSVFDYLEFLRPLVPDALGDTSSGPLDELKPEADTSFMSGSKYQENRATSSFDCTQYKPIKSARPKEAQLEVATPANQAFNATMNTGTESSKFSSHFEQKIAPNTAQDNSNTDTSSLGFTGVSESELKGFISRFFP